MAGKLHRREDVFGADVEDTMLLLNAETGRYHSLNPVAARIWESLAEPTDEAALVDRLVGEFDVSPDECRKEVSSFISNLRDRSLIVEL